MPRGWSNTTYCFLIIILFPSLYLTSFCNCLPPPPRIELIPCFITFERKSNHQVLGIKIRTVIYQWYGLDNNLVIRMRCAYICFQKVNRKLHFHRNRKSTGKVFISCLSIEYTSHTSPSPSRFFNASLELEWYVIVCLS